MRLLYQCLTMFKTKRMSINKFKYIFKNPFIYPIYFFFSISTFLMSLYHFI